MAHYNPSQFTITTDVDGRRVVGLVSGSTALAWYNVRDYGALGDDSTDDYAAFIAARDAIWDAGVAAVLYIPSGIYRSSNFIQLQSPTDRPPIYVLGDWCVLRSTTDTSFFYRKWDDSGAFTDVVQLVIDGCFFLPTVSGSSTGVHTVDSWGTIVRRCHFKNLKIGYHVQSVDSWNEGWISQDNIFDNCTSGFDFNKPGGTGSFQSGRMINTTIRVNASQTGIKIQSGANLYGSHCELQIWAGGNNAIGIDIDGNIDSCKFAGVIDNAGAGGSPLFAIRFGTNSTNTDAAQFSMDFAGVYSGDDPQTSAVKNAFGKTWYYDPLPYGSTQYIRKSVLTTTGDTLYASAANTPARRGIGSAGDLYKVSGGLPVWGAPAALTKVDDTNVTVTLAGSAATALVNAASITLGWSGQLAVSRGGIGVGTLASNGVLYGNGTGAVLALAVNATATNKYLRQVSSGAPSWETIPASEITSGAALTKTDDTNVTATLGGTPATALLVAASITLGWTGTLAQSRGGTGSATPFANPGSSVGLAVVNGVATTFMRSDAAPALSQAITPTWSGLHIHDQVGVRIQGTGGYFSVGVTGAPTNVTAGDATALRVFVGNSALLTHGGDVQRLQVSASVAADHTVAYIDSIPLPAGAASLSNGLFIASRVRPSADNSGGIHSGLTVEVTHDSGAFAIGSLYGVHSTVFQLTGSATDAINYAFLGELRPTSGTITVGATARFQVVNLGATISTGIGVDIGTTNAAGTLTTSIGLRINAATGTIGTDIAIQSLGGQHRFVGNVKIGANSAPTTALDVTGGMLVDLGAYAHSVAAEHSIAVIQATFTTSDAAASSTGLKTILDITPSTANTTAVHRGDYAVLTHALGNFNINAMEAVTGLVSNSLATVTEMNGVAGQAFVPGGTGTLARGVYARVLTTGGTITTGVGVDIDRGNNSGTFTTGIGLRINAISGSITTDIAIQSLGGQHRFVGNTRFGANTAPSFTVDVTGTLNTSAAITGGSTIDAVTGYRINGAAASGSIMVGNGTNFVSAVTTWSSFAAADSDFIGTTTGNADWVVTGGDLVAYNYSKIGNWMIVSIVVITSTIANNPDSISVNLPNGEVIAKSCYNACPASDNGTSVTAIIAAITGTSVIRFYLNANDALGGTTGWTNSTNNTAVFGYIAFPIT